MSTTKHSTPSTASGNAGAREGHVQGFRSTSMGHDEKPGCDGRTSTSWSVLPPEFHPRAAGRVDGRVRSVRRGVTITHDVELVGEAQNRARDYLRRKGAK